MDRSGCLAKYQMRFHISISKFNSVKCLIAKSYAFIISIPQNNAPWIFPSYMGVWEGEKGDEDLYTNFYHKTQCVKGKKKYFKSLLKFSKKLTNVVRARGISTWISITKPNASRGKKNLPKSWHSSSGRGGFVNLFLSQNPMRQGKKKPSNHC